MLPLYAARIEDLGQGDFVKVDCAACHHVRVADTGGLRKARPEPRDKGSRPQRTAPVPWMREQRASGGLVKMGAAGSVRVVGDEDAR